nr:EOG090X0BB3 [Sida crystallina]
MAEDREVLREVWEGRLPVCFTLATEEVNTPIAPDPFYLMVPRITYFPLITDKVRRHFVRYVAAEKSENEMWLEFELQPLKWHLPIGLLYDLNVTDQTLPWQIVVHFDKFPENKLMKFPTKDVIESHLMSSLKEADAMKHKNHIMSLMQERDHHQLWLGLSHDKFDQFWSVNRKLMEHSSGEGFRHIPFRLYVAEASTRPFIQFLIKPIENDKPMTLDDLLQRANLNSKGPFNVVTHGVGIPLETPLQWMSEHLSYPDNFLHLCICPIDRN